MTGNLSPNAQLDERQWFRATFGRSARRRIESRCATANSERSFKRLLIGEAETVTAFLSDLLQWFDNPRDRDDCAVPILRRLVEIAESFEVDAVRDVEQLHFVYQRIMEVAYKLRAEPCWFETARWAAQAQIAIADRVAAAMRRSYGPGPLPAHRGYERLAILADKARDDAGVIQICERARTQGWQGAWDDRIFKAQKRLARRGS